MGGFIIHRIALGTVEQRLILLMGRDGFALRPKQELQVGGRQDEPHSEVGANAVVGVDLDYVELSSMKPMVMLMASGTAVVLEE